MKCEKLRRMLTDYVDGLLGTGRAERVREHLAACEACREEEASARAAVESLAALPDLAPPEDALSRIEARVAFLPPLMPRERGGILRTFVLPYAAGLATAAVLLLVVLPLARPPTPAPLAPAGGEVVRTEPAPLMPGEIPMHYVGDDNMLRELSPGMRKVLRERQLVQPAGYEGY